MFGVLSVYTIFHFLGKSTSCENCFKITCRHIANISSIKINITSIYKHQRNNTKFLKKDVFSPEQTISMNNFVHDLTKHTIKLLMILISNFFILVSIYRCNQKVNKFKFVFTNSLRTYFYEIF